VSLDFIVSSLWLGAAELGSNARIQEIPFPANHRDLSRKGTIWGQNPRKGAKNACPRLMEFGPVRGAG
jgi:hypothetical protein